MTRTSVAGLHSAGFDRERLARLAAGCGLAPAALLVAAARLARDPHGEPDRLERVLAAAQTPGPAARHLAALLATPVMSFAGDDTDRALAALAATRNW